MKRRNQVKLARLEIVAQLYKRGYKGQEIQAEVSRRLNLESYDVKGVYRDTHTLLKEWREARLYDMDDALQLELERIDDTIKELWQQWEKSKLDYDRTTDTKKAKRKGVRGTQDAGEPYGVETQRTNVNVVGLGNPAYIAEIRQQLVERRKLLGLYGPEKRVTTTNVSVLRSPCDMSVEEIEEELRKLRLKTGE